VLDTRRTFVAIVILKRGTIAREPALSEVEGNLQFYRKNRFLADKAGSESQEA